MADPKCDAFIEELCRYHVSGTLKVAPEHVSKTSWAICINRLRKSFSNLPLNIKRQISAFGMKQYLIPYFISSHPGSTLKDAVELALFLKEYGFVPDQVQDFYPTPGTLATCMYYTEMDPLTMEPVYVAKTMEEKKMQRALIHFHKREKQQDSCCGLKKAGKKT